MADDRSTVDSDVDADLDERSDALARVIDQALEDLEEELSTRYTMISDALGYLDNDLAEEDHLQAEQQIDTVHQALTGVDTYLIRLRVLKDIDSTASSGPAVDIATTNLYDVLRTPPTIPEPTADLPDGSDLDEDEWGDAIAEAAGAMADVVRTAGDAVENAWSDAVHAAESGSLADILRHIMLLHAHAGHLQAAFDEWFRLLGTLSNSAPGRLTGAAAAAVSTFQEWSESQEVRNQPSASRPPTSTR
ncbi:hypothetical protein [Myceligenerans indicum]|nr:hypothetical protein [Myceligenerans indicum]